MAGDVDIAAIGALLADPSRAAMLMELLGGEPLAATELARRAGISPSGASNHLRKLRELGLVDLHVFGRRHLYRLGSPDVAAALEALGRIAPQTRAQTLRAVTKRHALERARSCYDHLAGRLGVDLATQLVELRVLCQNSGAYSVTERGARWFRNVLDIETDELRATRRRFAYECPDLTEARPHVGGALGAAVAVAFLDRSLVRRASGNRALHITERGSTFLASIGVDS
jgi:DNA-binding transcriptional ArsR family regulator